MYGPHETSLVMMVTTFKEVKKGEEIVASYIHALRSLWDRNFMESHGFICKCRLCELDRSESAYVITKREALLKSLTFDPVRYLKAGSLHADCEIIGALEELRAATPDLNIALTNSDIYKIASIIMLNANAEELNFLCLLILEKVYAVIENVPPNCVTRAYAETILVCCMKMGKEKEVLEKWVEEVRKYCRLYAGTLEHVRAGDYPTIPEDLKKFGIEFFND
ncbi:uncharacterized protein LOC118436843 [Folsomia candida]|nr:uncharacterized protein LOC118436843 [Folsomia candida]